MKTLRDYYAHLEAAKAIETTLDLQRRGYDVNERVKIGNNMADLVATKGDKTVLFEFKSRGSTKEKHAENLLLRYAKEHGYEYRVVIVSPPARVVIEVEEFESTLCEYLINNAFPEELYDIASAPAIDDVVDVDFNSLSVTKEEIRIKGTGTIEVTLRYGGGEERDGVTANDEYPLDFDVTMDHDLSIIDAETIRVDVSSFYE
jgi:Holliday junction resolvase